MSPSQRRGPVLEPGSAPLCLNLCPCGESAWICGEGSALSFRREGTQLLRSEDHRQTRLAVKEDGAARSLHGASAEQRPDARKPVSDPTALLGDGIKSGQKDRL